jgi:ribonuclease P protein component
LVVHAGRRDDARVLVGFIVNKAVGNAVVRNRVKRRLRAIMAGLVETVPAGTGLVVRSLPAAAGSSFSDLTRQLTGALGDVVGRLGCGVAA